MDSPLQVAVAYDAVEILHPHGLGDHHVRTCSLKVRDIFSQ